MCGSELRLASSAMSAAIARGKSIKGGREEASRNTWLCDREEERERERRGENDEQGTNETRASEL